MPEVIIIINTDVGKEGDVLKELTNIPEVESAYIVYGVYDLVAKVNTKDMDQLNLMISDRIRRIAGVRSTLTLVISKEHRKG
ncbi:MAG TPA: Lrp/AsnC ligand binding domain-containing protein [Methanomassiliicoccales archaeon]|nr:Lrp/AsnC ligand binding domain-containing protein [Methanomassiliicoccales archaeon]